MGTYSDSKLRVARKHYQCEACPDGEIFPGDTYLDYKPGLRSSIRIGRCCYKRTKPDGSPVFDTAATREDLGLPRDITRIG